MKNFRKKKKLNKKLLQQKDEIISNREKTIEKQKKYIEELEVMVDSWKEQSEHHWDMAHDPNRIDTDVLCMIRKPYIKEIENLKMINESNALALKESEEIIAELKAQNEKMKENCLDVMRVQGSNLTDDYMAGMYNGSESQ